jgi:hypothetical protein
MDSAIVVSMVTGGFSLIGIIITNVLSNRKIEHQLETSMAVTNTKLEALTKQVEKHNQVVERTFRLEATVADIKSDVDAYKGAWK